MCDFYNNLTLKLKLKIIRILHSIQNLNCIFHFYYKILLLASSRLKTRPNALMEVNYVFPWETNPGSLGLRLMVQQSDNKGGLYYLSEYIVGSPH